MRVERKGGPPDLEPAFTKFMRTRLGGRVLDDEFAREAAEGKFPDFECLRGLLLVEMKHFEADQHNRLNEVIHAKTDPAERPLFYGSRDAQHIFDAVSNGDDVRSELTSKLARTVEKHLRQGNRQFESYRARHPRKNSVSILVFLNSQVREFTPDVVLRAVHGKMKGSSGSPRFPHIDAVLYVSEKHFTPLRDGRIAFPIGIFENLPTIEQPWKATVLERVAQGWSEQRTGEGIATDAKDEAFDVIDDIPQKMKRYERWILEYKRRPYMSHLSDEELKVVFNRNVAVSALVFFQGSWAKPPHDRTMANMRQFSHIIEETNRRGTDLRAFGRHLLTPEQRARVCAGLPQELINILFPHDASGGKAA